MPRDGLISSFFNHTTAVKPSNGGNVLVGSTNAPTHNHARTRAESSEVEESSRPTKIARVQTTSSNRDGTTIKIKSSLDQWKYSQNDVLPIDGPLLTQTQRTAEQEARHNAFQARLLVSIDRREKREEEKRREAAEAEMHDEDEAGVDDDDDDDVEEGQGSSDALADFVVAPKNGRTRAVKEVSITDGIKYTPLEKQYLELRKANPDVLLCVEVGYKFKFYGDDARVASRELNIACFMEKHLMTAMVPLHRLQLHIKKLVLAGHKVGVVRQMETRALKAASSNASKPFTRKLTELYTASTWVDDMIEANPDGTDASSPRSLVAIVEKPESGTNSADEKVSIGMIAIQTSTGTITYDQFNDTTMRSELETRLAHLEPAEMILAGQISKQTRRLLRYIAGQSSQTPTAVRIETIEAAPTYNEAYSSVGEFYKKADFAKDCPSSKVDSSEILSVVIDLPKLALIALAVAIEHLGAFHLDSVFRLATNFTSFGSRHEMLLTGNTLSNLEILQNNTDFRVKGSLMWMMSAGCTTVMGKRLLRRWLTRPLTNIDGLRDRSNAVESLLNERHIAAKATSLLKGLPDLEKGLARLLYHRAAPTELASVLLSLNRVTTEFEPGQYVTTTLGSHLLDDAIATLPKARSIVQEALAAISIVKARDNNKRDLFVDVDRFEYVQDTKDLISVIDCNFHEHLLELRKIVKNPRLQYATVAGEEYLIEVVKDTRLPLPPQWLRISSTKKVLRYRSPEVIQMMKERAQLQEVLDAQAEEAYRTFVRELCDKHYSLLRDVITSLATLDALLSLSVLASLPGYSKAKFVQESDCIELYGFRHPMTEAIQESSYVDNDISLGDKSADKARGVLLTGSNMGGKSSTVRAIALVVIMAQVGSYVPATHAILSLHDAVLTRMGASDQLAKGRSTFMVEVQETAEIMKAATNKSLVLLDELGRGTSTHDGQAIAEAVLQHLLEREVHRRPMLFFVTHFLSLGRMMATLPLRGMHMAYLDRGNNNITFLYKIRDGLAEKSFGIHCARLANLPTVLLNLASVKAKELEEKTLNRSKQRQMARAIQAVKIFFSQKDWKEEDVLHVRIASDVLCNH